jgi:hypothetical protein
MATVRYGSTRIVAATNHSDFKRLKTTSDRYPAALARWAILPAWSLTFAAELQTARKNLHESALKIFTVHFSVPHRFAGRRRPRHPIAVPTPDPPPGTLATSSSFSRKISTELAGILGLLRSP